MEYRSAVADIGRPDEAIAIWHRVYEHVHPDDPATFRQTAAKTVRAEGDLLSRLERYEEAAAAWSRVVEYVRTEDPEDLRYVAAMALVSKGNKWPSMEEGQGFALDRYECSTATWQLACEYVCPDDMDKLRHLAAMLLSARGNFLNVRGKPDEAEAACRRATLLDAKHGESWRVLAEAIMLQNKTERLQEAENCARRAVEIAPESPKALHTLSDVKACLGKWSDALNEIERAMRIGGTTFQLQEWPGLTESLIRAVTAGHARLVKSMMKEAGLAEPMEPLWHAVRAELGEELEPLPAEIMETVTELRGEFAVAP